MLNFLASALQSTSSAIFQALTAGKMTPIAAHALEIAEVTEAAARESGARVHLPSRWSLPPLGFSTQRRAALFASFDPSIFYPQSLCPPEMNVNSSSIFIAASSSFAVAASYSARTPADALIQLLKEARRQRLSLFEIRNIIASGYHRNVKTILTERIDERREAVTLVLTDLLAASLDIDREKASAIIDLWLVYRCGSIFFPEEWKMKREKLSALIAERLEERLSQKQLAPVDVAKILEGAPLLILATLGNVVVDGRTDAPRKSRIDMARQVFSDETRPDHTRQVDFWEDFWEVQSTKFFWKIKERVRVDPLDIFSAMSYAKSADWPMSRFRAWLVERLQAVPEEIHILLTFDGVFDAEMITGKRKAPRGRSTFTEILESAKVKPTLRRKYSVWMNRWIRFSREMGGPPSLRPDRGGLGKSGSRQKHFEALKVIFDPRLPERVPLTLHQQLLESGYECEAGMLANVAVGITNAPRISANSVSSPAGLSPAILEKWMIDLAQGAGFAIKERPVLSVHHATSRPLGMRLKVLEQKALQSRQTWRQFGESISQDAEMIQLMGDRFPPFGELLQWWIEHRLTLSALPSGLLQGIAKKHGIPVDVVRTWWRRFQRWNTLQRLEL